MDWLSAQETAARPGLPLQAPDARRWHVARCLGDRYETVIEAAPQVRANTTMQTTYSVGAEPSTL